MATQITSEILGQVQTITYIKFLMALAYIMSYYRVINKQMNQREANKGPIISFY